MFKSTVHERNEYPVFSSVFTSSHAYEEIDDDRRRTNFECIFVLIFSKQKAVSFCSLFCFRSCRFCENNNNKNLEQNTLNIDNRAQTDFIFAAFRFISRIEQVFATERIEQDFLFYSISSV